MSFLIRSLMSAAQLPGMLKKPGRRPFGPPAPEPTSAQGMANTFVAGLGNQLAQAGQSAFAPTPEPEAQPDQRFTTGQYANISPTFRANLQGKADETSAIQAKYAEGRKNYEAMMNQRRMAYQAEMARRMG